MGTREAAEVIGVSVRTVQLWVENGSLEAWKTPGKHRRILRASVEALLAQRNAPDIDPRNFTAMTRLDHNRAITQIALKTGKTVNDVTKMTIWGNHSATQYPDLFNTVVDGQPAINLVDQSWYEEEFIPVVQQRGAAIIKARGASSAASAANAAIDHMRDWVLGTPDGDWVSMAVASDGSYGIAEGVFFSYPVTRTKTFGRSERSIWPRRRRLHRSLRPRRRKLKANSKGFKLYI